MSDAQTPPPGKTPAPGQPSATPPDAPDAAPLEIVPESTPLATGTPPPDGQPATTPPADGQALVVIPPAAGKPPPSTPIDYAMPSSKTWIPSPALIKNLGCIFKMLFGFTVLLVLGYVMLMALNPKARQWALQGTPQGSAFSGASGSPGGAGDDGAPGPTPFKTVNQILALPAQALAKTDDVVQANNARVGMLDGVIADEEAAAQAGRAGPNNPFLALAQGADASPGAKSAPGAKAGPGGGRTAQTAATEDEAADAGRAAQAARLMALQEKTQASGQTDSGAKADAVRSTALATQETPLLDPIALPGGIIIQAASPEGAPPPSRTFLYWIVGLNISGINPPRLLINGRLVHEQQEVHLVHGITFDRFDPARRLLYFRDQTGAVVTRSY